MKKFLVLIIGVLMLVVVFVYVLLIFIDDNGDGIVYIEGGFLNGVFVEGVEIIIVKDKVYNGLEEFFKGKEIIYKGKLDVKNSLILLKFVIEKYEVYFNVGEGYVVSKKGFVLIVGEKVNWDKVIVSFDFGEWKELMMEK